MNINLLTKKIIIVVAAVLVFLGVFALGGYFAQKTGSGFIENSNKEVNSPTPLLGGDRDVNGCIGSAGYSWCDLKQKCLRIWEEKCESEAIVVPFANTPVSPSIDLVTYKNPEYGISFDYPAKYKNALPPEYLPLLQYRDYQKPAATLADTIDVVWLPFKSGISSEQALIDDVYYDGSGMHPKSFDDFSLIHLGYNDFYKIRTGLFEGVLGYRYYLIRQDGAYVFKLTSLGVPWTDATFNPETEVRHLELQEILKTVKLMI